MNAVDLLSIFRFEIRVSYLTLIFSVTVAAKSIFFSASFAVAVRQTSASVVPIGSLSSHCIPPDEYLHNLEEFDSMNCV